MSAAGPGTEEERLLELLYQMPVGVMRCAADGTVELMNPLVACHLAHLTSAWTTGRVFDLLASCFPDLRSMMEEFGERCGMVFEGKRIPLRSPLPGGETTWLSLSALKLSGGEFALVVNDVTREVMREQQLRQASAWISALVQGSAAHMTCKLDRHGRISKWTSSAQQLTGWSAEEVIGRHCAVLFLEDHALPARLDARLQRTLTSGWDLDEGWQQRRDAPPFFASCIVTALGDGSPGHQFLLVARDVTDRRQVAESLRRMTVLDFLTGAYNRAYLFTVGKEELAKAGAAGQPVAAVMIDADHFKAINDRHGHGAGDAVLKRIAAACQQQLRPGDLLARLGGEEFVALLPGCDATGALDLARRMQAAITQAVVAHEHAQLRVTASFGVAAAPGADVSLEALLQEADAALYRAKADGRNTVRLAAPLPAV